MGRPGFFLGAAFSAAAFLGRPGFFLGAAFLGRPGFFLAAVFLAAVFLGRPGPLVTLAAGFSPLARALRSSMVSSGAFCSSAAKRSNTLSWSSRYWYMAVISIFSSHCRARA